MSAVEAKRPSMRRVRPRLVRMVRSWRGACLLRLMAASIMIQSGAGYARPSSCDRASDNARLLVVSDIGNEPDDAESFVRLLLYTNEIDIEGVVASTSVWQRDKVRPDLFLDRIRAYRQVLANLRVHDCRYPSAETLAAQVSSGSGSYGMSGVGPGRDTEGSRRIVSALDRPDPRPLWIALWGGAVDLAQALWSIRATRTPEQLAAAVAKLRVYAISDQDDAGPWIRGAFPTLLWVGSVHGFNDYELATWRGISGDLYRRPDEVDPPVDGPDGRLVTNAWLRANIMRGPLGRLYPPWLYAMEGDTPSFLNLIRNGLSVPERPEWGGWGGRYARVAPGVPLFVDTVDEVPGRDGRLHRSPQATIWRWRQGYQNDFAARIAWTTAPRREDANHPPVVIVNGDGTEAPLLMPAIPGSHVLLDASGSRDPDGSGIDWDWRFYPEATGRRTHAGFTIVEAGLGRASVSVPADFTGEMHLVLAVTDRGRPALTRYRRVILSSKAATK